MNQHAHDKHHHGQHSKKSGGLHKDWRAWVAIALMLAAILMYVVSDDESLQPGKEYAPGGLIDSPPIEAAP